MESKFSLIKINSIVVILFSFLFVNQVEAQGNLLITPKRVVFEGSKRSEELNLANIGKDSATYSITFVQLRMTEFGTFEEILLPDSGQLFADKYLRIFPRTVTLSPNESQTVKLELRRSSDLVIGEYRSHLKFRAVPREAPLGEKAVDQDSGISVKLIPIFGISLPIIIKNGESTTTMDLTDASFKIVEDTIPQVKLFFNRNGNMSTYGDITFNHISNSGKITLVGSVKGFSVYTPNKKRMLTFNLDKPVNVDYKSGRISVYYHDQNNKNIVFGNTEIKIQ